MRIHLYPEECKATSEQVRVALEAHFEPTRFLLVAQYVKGEVDLKFRLKTKKAYCGNHPGECKRPHFGPHRKYNILEGADWAEVNDRINDVLDSLEVSARVGSVVVIRKHRCRLTFFRQNDRGAFQNDDWKRVGEEQDYIDYIGREAPPSTFSDGTPGIYDYKGVQYVELTDAEHVA